MSDDLRDQFAAAALTGLISLNCPGPNQQHPQELCERAYRWADVLLAERAKTNHDAVPAARATADSIGTDKAEPLTRDGGTGITFPPGSHAESQSPASECGGGQSRDVPQPDNGLAAGGPGHHTGASVSGSLPDCLGDGVSPSDDDKNLHHILSQAETDALEYVVEKGRIASNIDYGVLRSLLIRLRPEWERLHSDGAGYAGGISADAETKSDRSKPIKEGVFDRSKPIAGGGK